MSGRVLIAGVGNVFLSDDGFGVEVAGALATRELPAGIEVRDYGIRGLHLAYELLDRYDSLVFVDTIDLGDAPGTISVLEADPVRGLDADGQAVSMDGHSVSPNSVLNTLSTLGGRLRAVRVVGCQPETLAEGMGLSGPVAASIPIAADAAVQAGLELLGAG